MPVIQIPPPYRGPTQGLAEVKVSGSTLRECLEAVEAQYPGFAQLVLDDAGQLRPFATWFRNGDRLTGDFLDTSLEPTDYIGMISSVAGG